MCSTELKANVRYMVLACAQKGLCSCSSLMGKRPTNGCGSLNGSRWLEFRNELGRTVSEVVTERGGGGGGGTRFTGDWPLRNLLLPGLLLNKSGSRIQSASSLCELFAVSSRCSLIICGDNFELGGTLLLLLFSLC